MLNLSDFRNYITQCKTDFTEISMSKTVMDDSQLNRFLDDVKESDNHVLIGIIPKHNPFGNSDSVQSRDTMSFLILKKIDRSDINHEQYLDILQQAQDITRKLLQKMIADNINGGVNCNIMQQLDVPSIDINPIWGLAGCDGYEIDFSIYTGI